MAPVPIDGGAIQGRSLRQLKPYAPLLRRLSVAILVPYPGVPLANEAYISARAKLRLFEAVGIVATVVRPDEVAVGPGQLYVIQRPLSAPQLDGKIDPRAINLDALPQVAGGDPISTTAEVVRRLLEGMRGQIGTLGVVGAKGVVGTQICALANLMGLKLIEVDIEQSLILLSDCDAVVSAVGSPHLVQPTHLRERLKLLLDVGFIYDEAQGSVLGDIDPRSYQRADFYTPVPGGIGPLQVLTLLERAIAFFPSVNYTPWNFSFGAGNHSP